MGGGREVGNRPAMNRILNLHEVEAAGFGVEPQNSRQHEGGSNHGVEEEFHRRVDLAPVAVHADEESHRNQSCFPEKVEEEQVKRCKDADQGGL